MNKRVTIKDVAAEAGVSIGLVSLVLHATIDADGKPDCNVRKETASRILKAVKKLGYIPNAAASSIRTGRSFTIAVITPDLASVIFSEICRLIENYAYNQGYNVIFASSDENPTKFSQIIQSAMSRNVDGMIILPPPHADIALERLENSNLPIVFLERYIPGFSKAGRILLDNVESIRLAIDELYNSGYKKIQLIASDMDITTIHDRVSAYESIMESKGLSDDSLVNYVSHNVSVDEMSDLLKNSVSRGAEAFVLLSHSITVTFLLALKRLNWKAPRNLAFVGFNSSNIYEMTDYSVSYISESKEELVSSAVSLLLDMIEEKADPATILLKPVLIQGDSSS